MSGHDLKVKIKGANKISDLIPNGQKKTVLMTGATDGIGKAMCIALANKGYSIILCARSEKKASEMIKALKKINNAPEYHFVKTDLADTSSCKNSVQNILYKNDKIDYIFANAGMICQGSKKNKNGLNETFHVNHTGHFLLIDGVLQLLGKKHENRVIVQSSLAHWYHSKPICFEKYFRDESQESSSYYNAYADSKFANILFARKLDRVLKGVGKARALAVHPGYAVTNINKNIVDKTWKQALSDMMNGNNRSLLLKLGYQLGLSQPTMLDAALCSLDAAFRENPFEFTGPSGPFELKGEAYAAKLDKEALNEALQDKLWNMTEKYLRGQAQVSRESHDSH